jgi:hypothetical protein
MSKENEENLLGNDSVCGLFVLISCDVKCTALFPNLYPRVLLGIKLAKEAGLIDSESACKVITGDIARFTAILAEVNIPGADVIVSALAGSCGQCACEKIF